LPQPHLRDPNDIPFDSIKFPLLHLVARGNTWALPRRRVVQILDSSRSCGPALIFRRNFRSKKYMAGRQHRTVPISARMGRWHQREALIASGAMIRKQSGRPGYEKAASIRLRFAQRQKPALSSLYACATNVDGQNCTIVFCASSA